MIAPLAKGVLMLALPAALLAPVHPVHAAEVGIATSRVLATAFEAGLASEFEEATGHRLRVVAGDSPELIKRVLAGEPFDIVVAPAPAIDRLVESGRVVTGTRTPLVRSRLGVAVRAGAPKPDLSSVDAFKRALLSAKSVGYRHIAGVPELMQQIGLAQAIAPKAAIAQTYTVCKRVAAGEVELGVAIVAQILAKPGVELAAALPPETELWVIFTAAVLTNAIEPRAARELIEFLARSKAHPLLTLHGLEPA